MNRITITLQRQVEKAVFDEAAKRGMTVKDVCEELIEVGLVSLQKFGPATKVEEFATMKRESPEYE